MRKIHPVRGPDLKVARRVKPGPTPAAVTELASYYGNGQRPATAGRLWLRANMIASTDGAAELGGKSGALGGPADRMVFTVLRSLADVILVGAGTARAEHYRPVRAADVWPDLRAGRVPTPAVAVVTDSLNLDACARLLTSAPAGAQTIVLTSAGAPSDKLAALADCTRVIVAGEQHVDMRTALAALAGLGYRQILAEGGPHLLGELVSHGLLDELCITTSPVLAAGAAGRIAASADPDATPVPAARLSLAHVLAHESFLLSRYIRVAG